MNSTFYANERQLKTEIELSASSVKASNLRHVLPKWLLKFDRHNFITKQAHRQPYRTDHTWLQVAALAAGSSPLSIELPRSDRSSWWTPRPWYLLSYCNDVRSMTSPSVDDLQPSNEGVEIEVSLNVRCKAPPCVGIQYAVRVRIGTGAQNFNWVRPQCISLSLDNFCSYIFTVHSVQLGWKHSKTFSIRS